MLKKELFWYSKVNEPDSFSRIFKSMNKTLQEFYNIHIIVPGYKILEKELVHFKKIRMGDPLLIDDSLNTYDSLMNDNSLKSKIIYSFLQVLYYCLRYNIDYLLILMGVYEANVLLSIISTFKKSNTLNTKIILYTPFDYLPSYKCIDNYRYADKIITTINVSEVCKYYKNVYELGHANDEHFKKLDVSRSELIKIINKWSDLIKKKPIKCKDIIILNANNYGSRKRLETTVDVFIKIMYEHPNLKLWLHGGDNLLKNIHIVKDIPLERLIISGPMTESQLNIVYNICQIGLQTSWGEGWSLTNCEHSVCGSLQVVPDFMATGVHFGQGRGLLIPVTVTDYLNEDNIPVKIGIVSVDDTAKVVMNAIDIVKNSELLSGYVNSCVEYFKKFNFVDLSHRLNDIISY